jgi:hypothetical protein
MRPSALVFVLVAFLATAPAADGQSFRAQASWTAGHVGGLVLGLDGRKPLGPGPELPLPGAAGRGPVEAPTRPWVLTGMVGLGINVAPPDEDPDVEALLQGHGGLLYRTGSSLVTAVGGVVVVYLPQGAVGPAAVVEAADLIDLQTGLLSTDRGWMGHLALTVAVSFVNDILGG